VRLRLRDILIYKISFIIMLLPAAVSQSGLGVITRNSFYQKRSQAVIIKINLM
jgi:hypothetical protein